MPDPPLLVYESISPARPTTVYDTYWRFASERQNIFFRRYEQEAPPWTEDPILRKYKFTNAYRASDRVSQFLIRNVIYRGEQSADEVFFRTILFKIFNKIETWQLLQTEVGPITFRDYSFDRYDEALTKRRKLRNAIYSAAYMMPSGRRSFGHPIKHRNHLLLLELMMQNAVPQRIAEMHSMAEAFDLLRGYPMIGDFLAYQYVIDLNYSEITDFSESEFVVLGPGAKDGLRKCFVDLGGLSEEEMVRFVTDHQEQEFDRLGLSFKSLWGRHLQLIDCQNLFCEVDKYARVKHPEILGISRRTRIKQKFQSTPSPIDYWYPPKWGLNEIIEAEKLEASSTKELA